MNLDVMSEYGTDSFHYNRLRIADGDIRANCR